MPLIRKLIIGLLVLPLWHLIRLLPRKKELWVFGAWNGLRYTDNPKAFFEFLNFEGNSINPVWITQNVGIYNNLNQIGLKCYMRHSFMGLYICLRASVYIISSTKNDINPFLSNGAILVQTWHGSPIKKIGIDAETNHSRIRKLMKILFPFYYEYTYDYVVSGSEYFNDYLSSAFGLNKEQLLTTGLPRNDVFFNQKKSEFLEFIIAKFNQPNIICYLPTFRDFDKSYNLFSNHYFNVESWSEFFIENNTILLLKLHPASSLPTDLLKDDRIIVIEDTDESDLNLMLKYVNILITDYSSVYFDFLLTKRPIVLAPFDYDEYIEKSREMYFNYDELDGPRVSSWSELLQYLKGDRKEKFDLTNNFNKYEIEGSCSRLFEELKSIVYK